MATATEIRVAVIGLLEDALIVPAGSVHDTRTIKYQVSDLPAIAVFTLTTRPTSRSMTSQLYKTVYRVAVEVTTEAASDAALGASLDSYELEVLNAILAPSDWVDDLQLEGIEWSETSKGKTAEGDYIRGACVVSFDVALADEFEPTGTLAFDKIHVEVTPPNGTAHTTPAVWEAEP